jgi:hypothetical protein
MIKENKNSVRKAGLQVENKMQNDQNMKQECSPLHSAIQSAAHTVLPIMSPENKITEQPKIFIPLYLVT